MKVTEKQLQQCHEAFEFLHEQGEPELAQAVADVSNRRAEQQATLEAVMGRMAEHDADEADTESDCIRDIRALLDGGLALGIRVGIWVSERKDSDQ